MAIVVSDTSPIRALHFLVDRLRLGLRFRIAEKLYDEFLKAIGEL
jgi:hypothetical protein